MTETGHTHNESNAPRESHSTLPVAVRHRQRERVSISWVVPVLAMLVVGWLGYSAWRERGEKIQISFSHAHSIEVDDPVVHRGVRVGIVRAVDLSYDNQGVVVIVELRRDARSIATSDAQFWIVRPEVSLKRVAGLETLLGPRLIRVEPGTETTLASSFVGLDQPPAITSHSGDALRVYVEADRLGSLVPGGPVLYRDVQVGQIVSYELAADATSVRIELEIRSSYAPLITDTTRFWNASGIDLDIGLFNGVTFRTDSLESVLTGGVAFATPTKPGQRVGNFYVFELASEAKSDWHRWKPKVTLEDHTPTK